MTAATLMAFQRWGENTDADELADLEQRMHLVSSEDFRHKLTYGWEGRKNGRGSTVRGFSRQHDDVMFFLLGCVREAATFCRCSQLPTAK